MCFRLRQEIHAAAIGEDLVLLDLRRDAYLCLPGGAAAASRGWTPEDPSFEALRAADLLEPGPPRAIACPGATAAEGLPTGEVRVGAGDVLRLMAAVLDLLSGYAGRSLAGILDRGARGGGRGLDGAGVVRLAQVFERLAPYLPISGKCLVRSFVLLRFIQRSGGRAAWMFGVRTWPFGAHCWLQLGDRVLDDHPDRLAGYAPILTVGP